MWKQIVLDTKYFLKAAELKFLNPPASLIVDSVVESLLSRRLCRLSPNTPDGWESGKPEEEIGSVSLPGPAKLTQRTSHGLLYSHGDAARSFVLGGKKVSVARSWLPASHINLVSHLVVQPLCKV